MQQERDFKGIWISKEIWLDTRLNALEKIILAEIDSLDNEEKGCFASNKYLADFCQCSETKVSTAISKLIEFGYLYLEKFDGRERILKSRLSNFERQTLKNCKADFKILKDNNKDNNKDNINNMICEFGFSERIKEFINLWLQYKKEKGQTYKKTGLNILLTRLKKDIEKNGEDFVINNIKGSIANNWAGIYECNYKNSTKPKDGCIKTREYTNEQLNGLFDNLEETDI